MKRKRRLAARFGRDGNPLRRRSDRILSWISLGLLAVFLAGAPASSFLAAHAVYRAAAAEQRDQVISRRQVEAAVQGPVITAGGYYGGGFSTWAWARWTYPAGHRQQGFVPVPTAAAAHQRVLVWVNASGRWSGPPLSRNAVRLREILATAGGPLALVFLLLGVETIARYVTERRQLAHWQTAWAEASPRWTRQFWAGG